MSKFASVATLVALTGCSAFQPSSQASEGQKPSVLATFSGEADPLAGAFSVRTDPASSRVSRALTEMTNVTVANAAAPLGGFACPGNAASFGAPVKIVVTPFSYESQAYDVYAEITSLGPPTGFSGCNSVTSPGGGVTADLGLWFYPSLSNQSPDATTSPSWQFSNPGATRATFQGRVMGNWATLATYSPTKTSSTGSFVFNGSNFVYFHDAGPSLEFLAPGSTVPTASVDFVLSAVHFMAIDANRTRIWAFEDGVSVAHADASDGANQGIFNIHAYYASRSGRPMMYPSLVYPVVDPLDAKKVWFATGAPDGITYATCTVCDGRASDISVPDPATHTAATWGWPSTSSSDFPAGLAVLNRSGTVEAYVSTGSQHIKVLNADLTPHATFPDIDLSSGVAVTGDCGTPRLMYAHAGKVWFNATKAGNSTNQLCQIDPATLALDEAKVPTAGVSVLLEGLPDAVFIGSFGLGSDSNVWVTTDEDPQSSSRGFQVARISVTAGALRFTPFAIPTQVSGMGGPWAPVTAQGGGQWVMDRSGTLYKLTLAQ